MSPVQVDDSIAPDEALFESKSINSEYSQHMFSWGIKKAIIWIPQCNNIAFTSLYSQYF